jgi:hypothetical protein
VKHETVTAVGTSNPNGSSENPQPTTMTTVTGQSGSCRSAPVAIAEHRTDAEQHPVEAEQRARCAQVVGHVERQSDLDRAVQQVEEPGERQQPEQLGMGPQQREPAAGGRPVDGGDAPRLRQPGARDEHGEEHVGQSVQAEHERGTDVRHQHTGDRGPGDRRSEVERADQGVRGEPLLVGQQLGQQGVLARAAHTCSSDETAKPRISRRNTGLASTGR